MRYIIIRQIGKINTTFKVTNPKKIKMWKMLAEKVSPNAIFVKTDIIEEGEQNQKPQGGEDERHT